eukprot:242971_1
MKINSILFQIFAYIHSIHSQNNYIIKDKSNYQRTPLSNNIIATIDILNEIYVEFNVIIHSWIQPVSRYPSIILIGKGATSKTYPAIYLDCVNQSIGSTWSTVETAMLFKSATLSLNTLYHFQFYATQDWMQIYINDTTIYNGTISSHTIWMNSNVYLSVPDDVADVTISGLIVSTSNTAYNYLCDYDNRFTNVIGTWTPTLCQVRQSDTSYGAIAWMGQLDSNSITWTDYIIESVINVKSGVEAIIIMRTQTVSTQNDQGKYYEIALTYNYQEINIYKINNGW